VSHHRKISIVTSIWAADHNDLVQEMDRDFSLLQSVQAGFGAISASYSMDTGIKEAGA
jgi:hypothetical protein